MSNKSKIADTISEKGRFVKIGIIPFYQRPLTLEQIYAVGAIIEPMTQLSLNEGERIAPVAEILNNYRDLKLCQKFILRMLFRRSYTRALFGWYVRRNLTMQKYKQILEFGGASFEATFFLSSLTFLKGVKEVTQMTMNMQEATPHGD